MTMRSLTLGLVAIALGWYGVAVAADDRATCTGPDVPNEARIEACTRVIGSGQLHGRELAGVHNKRGISYENKGDHDHALADFNKATKADPTFAAPYNNRGWTYNHKGEYDRANRS